MRPSNPGMLPGYGGHQMSHSPYGGVSGGGQVSNQPQFFPNRGPQITKANNLKYFPSLSGSETDVSTSTENLTQVNTQIQFVTWGRKYFKIK